MNFAYQGFTQDDSRRCFTFWSTRRDPVSIFSIEVELALLNKIRIPVQDGPMFCLRLLTSASLEGETSLERYQKYQLVEADFHSVIVERERQAAEKAAKKPARRPLHKPGTRSNFALGISAHSH